MEIVKEIKIKGLTVGEFLSRNREVLKRMNSLVEVIFLDGGRTETVYGDWDVTVDPNENREAISADLLLGGDLTIYVR